MADEENAGLSDEAQTYFDSRGEVAEAEPKEPVETPELETDDPAEPEPGEDSQPKVPLRALKKEREEARELKHRLQEIEKHNAVLEDRWNTLLRMQQEQPKETAQPEPPPDPDKDIFAFSRWQADQLKTLTEKLNGREQAEVQARQQTEHEGQIWNYWHADASKFTEENPDFGNAAAWLAEYRDKQLTALGKYDQRLSTKQGRDQQINAELRDIIVRSAQSRISPAQAVYEIAQGYGYKQAPAKAGASEIEAINKAAAGAETLSGGGGERPAASVDASAIANMSETEFASWLSKKGDAGFRKLMGG